MKLLQMVILLMASVVTMAQQPPMEPSDSTTVADSTLVADSIMALPQKKHPWIAAAAVAGLNTYVQIYNRYVTKEDFAQTTMRTLRRNFRTGLVWDNDKFIMNMFAHPYHGNLYFNIGRTNGMNFWESVPYALGGSLMWEFFDVDITFGLSSNQPLINDLHIVGRLWSTPILDKPGNFLFNLSKSSFVSAC